MSIRSAKALEDMLSEHGVRCIRLPVGGGAFLIVTDYGGRIFGPLSDTSETTDWWPAHDELRRCLQNGTWNIGGERVWLAPEAYFNYTDPKRIIDTYAVNPALDPARWSIVTKAGGLALSLEATIPLAQSKLAISLRIYRQIFPIVNQTGYTQQITVEQTSGEELPIVPWLIRQVVSGGEVVMLASPGAVGSAVFGQAPSSAILANSDRWRVSFSGPGFFKTIYHRNALRDGNMSYLPHKTSKTHGITLTPVMAAAKDYPEALPSLPFSPGHCASLFYDSGRFGAYGEIEIYGHLSERRMGYLETCNTLLD